MSTIRGRHSLPRPPPGIHRRMLSLANPLWRKHTQQLEVIVSWCKQGRGSDCGLPFMSPKTADLLIMRRVRRWRWCWDLFGRIPGIDYRRWEESGGGRDSRVENLGIAVGCILVRGNILLTCNQQNSKHTVEFIFCKAPELLFIFYYCLLAVLVQVCFSAT